MSFVLTVAVHDRRGARGWHAVMFFVVWRSRHPVALCSVVVYVPAVPAPAYTITCSDAFVGHGPHSSIGGGHSPSRWRRLITLIPLFFGLLSAGARHARIICLTLPLQYCIGDRSRFCCCPHVLRRSKPRRTRTAGELIDGLQHLGRRYLRRPGHLLDAAVGGGSPTWLLVRARAWHATVRCRAMLLDAGCASTACEARLDDDSKSSFMIEGG